MVTAFPALLPRAVVAAAAALVLVVAAPLAASAHVRVEPGRAAAGAESTQLAGWRATVTTARLPHPVEVDGARVTQAPAAVTWTADAGTRLTDGEFQSFTVAVGPMPDVGRLVLPVTQTYSDGSVVRWNERTTDGGAEPAHPAPVLSINDSPPAEGSAAGPTVVTQAAGVSDTLGLALGSAALVVALVALGLALGALLRSRRRGAR